MWFPSPARVANGRYQLTAVSALGGWAVAKTANSCTWTASLGRFRCQCAHREANLSVGTAQVLLGGKSLANTGCIDITRDGQRILLSQPQPNANTALTLALNWAALLKK